MKILNISPFYTVPPDNGGKTRIYKINEYLSHTKKYEIFQFSCNMYKYLGKLRLNSWSTKVNERYVEYCYSPTAFLIASYILNKLNRMPLAYLDRLLNIFGPSFIQKNFDESDLIQVEEPWQFAWVTKKNKKNKKIIADSQNVEYVLAKQYYEKFAVQNCKRFLDNIFQIEKNYAINSDMLFCASDEDKKDFIRLYDVNKDKIRIVPNGVDTKEFYPISKEKREKIKEKMGFKNKFIIFFVGGVHLPNLEALQFIKKLSKSFDDKHVLFLIAGAIGNNEKKTENITYTGGGAHAEMIKYFHASDIALNPVFSGSGTNVKLLQYLASGIPTITTKFGTRGLKLNNKKGLIIENTIQGFKDSIEKLINSQNYRNKLINRGPSLIKGRYDFFSIIKNVEKYYAEVLE